MSRSRRRLDPAPQPLRKSWQTRAVTSVLRAWQDPERRFLIRFPIVTALVFVFPELVPSVDRWLIHATIQSLATARFLLPGAVHVSEPAFGVGGTVIQIVSDCTPMFPTLLLIGGMLSFPSPWRWKAIGMVAGAIVLWLYNMLRIFVLMAVLHYAPARFDLVHLYLWQSVTLLAVVGCFLLWIRVSKPSEAHL